MQKQSWATLPGEPLACVKYKPAPTQLWLCYQGLQECERAACTSGGNCIKGKVANVDSEISMFVMGPTCKNGTVSGVPGLLLQGGGKV